MKCFGCGTKLYETNKPLLPPQGVTKRYNKVDILITCVSCADQIENFFNANKIPTESWLEKSTLDSMKGGTDIVFETFLKENKLG